MSSIRRPGAPTSGRTTASGSRPGTATPSSRPSAPSSGLGPKSIFDKSGRIGEFSVSIRLASVNRSAVPAHQYVLSLSLLMTSVHNARQTAISTQGYVCSSARAIIKCESTAALSRNIAPETLLLTSTSIGRLAGASRASIASSHWVQLRVPSAARRCPRTNLLPRPSKTWVLNARWRCARK